jgi:ribonuclease T1
MVPNPADPQSLNRYSYAANNPLLYVDPSGHDPNRPILHDYDDYAGSEPSPLADLWLYRVRDNPHCPSCSNATIPGILDEQWIQDHPGYTYANDSFKDRAAQWIAGNGGINGLTTSDLGDLQKYSGTISSAQETTSLEGAIKVTWKLGSELGLPLLAGIGQARNQSTGEAQAMMMPFADAGLRQRVGDVLNTIDQGGPFPYRRDGIVFQNREGLLPDQSTGYYQEYTVSSPGTPGRGAQRLVVGQGGEVYFTPDHYQTFVRVR